MNRWLFILLILSHPVRSDAQTFEYKVRHHHTLGGCTGTLRITAEGIAYLTARAQDARTWKFEEIRTLEVRSPAEIAVVSYEDQKRFLGKDRIFEFELLDKKATPDLSSFLLSHVKRPMELAVLPEVELKPVFEIPVKHLHTIVGATGVLRIYPDGVVFQALKQEDSRFWRLSDIERFSQPDRFRFQIVSYVPRAGGPTEVYNFQLMKDLPEGTYDYLWVHLHPSSYYPE